MAISSLLLHPSQHLHVLAATIFIRSLSVSTLVPPTHPEHNLLFVASYIESVVRWFVFPLHQGSADFVFFSMSVLTSLVIPSSLSFLANAAPTWLFFFLFLLPNERSALNYQFRLPEAISSS